LRPAAGLVVEDETHGAIGLLNAVCGPSGTGDGTGVRVRLPGPQLEPEQLTPAAGHDELGLGRDVHEAPEWVAPVTGAEGQRCPTAAQEEPTGVRRLGESHSGRNLRRGRQTRDRKLGRTSLGIADGLLDALLLRGQQRRERDIVKPDGAGAVMDLEDDTALVRSGGDPDLAAHLLPPRGPAQTWQRRVAVQQPVVGEEVVVGLGVGVIGHIPAFGPKIETVVAPGIHGEVLLDEAVLAGLAVNPHTPFATVGIGLIDRSVHMGYVASQAVLEAPVDREVPCQARADENGENRECRCWS